MPIRPLWTPGAGRRGNVHGIRHRNTASYVDTPHHSPDAGRLFPGWTNLPPEKRVRRQKMMYNVMRGAEVGVNIVNKGIDIWNNNQTEPDAPILEHIPHSRFGNLDYFHWEDPNFFGSDNDDKWTKSIGNDWGVDLDRPIGSALDQIIEHVSSPTRGFILDSGSVPKMDAWLKLQPHVYSDGMITVSFVKNINFMPHGNGGTLSEYVMIPVDPSDPPLNGDNAADEGHQIKRNIIAAYHQGTLNKERDHNKVVNRIVPFDAVWLTGSTANDFYVDIDWEPVTIPIMEWWRIVQEEWDIHLTKWFMMHAFRSAYNTYTGDGDITGEAGNFILSP